MVAAERVYTNVRHGKRLYGLSTCVIAALSEQSDRSSSVSPPRTVSESHPEEHGSGWDEWQTEQQVVAAPSATGKAKFGSNSDMEWGELIAAEQPPQATSITQQAASTTAQAKKPILEVLNKRTGQAECGAPPMPAPATEESAVRDFDPFVPAEQIPAADAKTASETSIVPDVLADKHELANVNQAGIRPGSRDEKCIFCPRGKCRNGLPVTHYEPIMTSEARNQEAANVKQPAASTIATGARPRRVISAAEYGVIRPRKSIGMWDSYSKLYKQAAQAVTRTDTAVRIVEPMPFVDGRVMALVASDSMAYKILKILNDDSKDVMLFELGPVGRQ